MNDYIKMIELVPQYICYLYPGYITLFFFNFFMEKTLSDTKAKIIKSIIISCIYVTYIKGGLIPTVSMLLHFDFSEEIYSILFHIILIILAIAMAYISFFMWEKSSIGKWIRRVLRIDTQTYKNEIDMLNSKYKDTIWVYVYLKDSNIMYEGSLTNWELEHGDRNRFFCLSKYRKNLIKKDGHIKKLYDYSSDAKEKVLIYFENIAYFEIANVDK